MSVEQKEIDLTEKAKADITKSVEYYENQKEGLGKEFKQEVIKVLEKIQQNPEQFQKIKSNTRSALLNRFSHGIFYMVKNVKIVVTHILHTSQNPKEWTKYKEKKD